MPFLPERKTGPELMDLPQDAYAPEELAGTLADLRGVNRYLGDVRAILKHMDAMAAGHGRKQLAVLDIATGSADIPVALAQWARRKDIGVGITAVDLNPEAVAIARHETRGYPEIHLAVADALNLPFADKSFDIVLCSKTLHHFSEDEAVRLVRGMVRVARRGYLLLDLRRSRIACWLIYLLTRLLTRNRLTRHDGPLSVLRSFTPEELATLASSAGASGFTITKEPFWLMVMTGAVQ